MLVSFFIHGGKYETLAVLDVRAAGLLLFGIG